MTRNRALQTILTRVKIVNILGLVFIGIVFLGSLNLHASYLLWAIDGALFLLVSLLRVNGVLKGINRVQ